MRKIFDKISKSMQNVDLKQILYTFIRCFLEGIICLINFVFLFLQIIIAIIFLLLQKITNCLLKLQQKIKKLWTKNL